MLESVRIQNFKSIRDVTVELSPVTILIGRSGAGKSNILRSLRFLRNFLLAPDEAVAIEGGWSRIWPCGIPSELNLSVQFVLPGFETPFMYRLGWESLKNQNSSRLKFESLSVGQKEIFDWAEDRWNLWPAEYPAPRHRPAQPQLGTFPTQTEAVLAYTALTAGIGWYDFPANVFSRTHEPGGDLARSLKGLRDNADNFVPVILSITQDLRDQLSRRTILARLKQINQTVRSVELDSIQNPQRVVVGHDIAGQKVALDLTQESDGFRRYYAHLLSLYQTPPKHVLMFEEPENGIYPGALRCLAEEFVAAAESNRGQILLTTQSPELLDGFEPEQLRVVELDSTTQETKVGLLDPKQVDAVREQLLNPSELLTVDTARAAIASAP